MKKSKTRKICKKTLHMDTGQVYTIEACAASGSVFTTGA
jgi:hypothetical protein